jgi:hypothetical protein
LICGWACCLSVVHLIYFPWPWIDSIRSDPVWCSWYVRCLILVAVDFDARTHGHRLVEITDYWFLNPSWSCRRRDSTSSFQILVPLFI